jgi:hypothetical protein
MTPRRVGIGFTVGTALPPAIRARISSPSMEQLTGSFREFWSESLKVRSWPVNAVPGREAAVMLLRSSTLTHDPKRPDVNVSFLGA